MKVQIKSDGTFTSLFVDGVELKSATSFKVHQEAGKVPMLEVKLYAADGLDIEISDCEVSAQVVNPEE